MNKKRSYTFIPFEEAKQSGKKYNFIPDNAPSPQEKEEEDFITNLARKGYQFVSGTMNATTIPLLMDALNMISTGAAYGGYEELEESLPRIKEMFPWMDLPEKIDRERYMQGVQEASEQFPTQRNIERGIESKTGLPLTSKTRADELIRLGGMGYKFGGNSPIAAVGVPTASQTAVELGVPEPIADTTALLLSNPLGKTYSKTPTISKETKPSGLTTRRYESLKKPKEVSPNVIKRITEKTEAEFKEISNKLIQEGEGAKTYNALKDDSSFKSKIGDLFKEVESKAAEIEEPLSVKTIKKDLMDISSKSSEKGFVDSSYDKSYRIERNKMIKDIKAQNVSAKQLVEQYRKNNAQLSEQYDPSISRAQNRAKKDALLDFNKVIAKTIKEQFPESELNNLFEFTNRQWSKIKDAEYVDKFIDDMFNGKIKYDKGRKFFDNENAQLPFKRILGDEGYKSFETLMDDLMSTEQASKMLKTAKSKGLGELGDYAMSFVIHPAFAKGKFLSKAYKTMMNNLLDKPKLSIKWKKGVDQFKQGNIIDAAKTFEELESNLED